LRKHATLFFLIPTKCRKILRFFFKYFVLIVRGEKFSGYLLTYIHTHFHINM
jgi:hypothetical protein